MQIAVQGLQGRTEEGYRLWSPYRFWQFLTATAINVLKEFWVTSLGVRGALQKFNVYHQSGIEPLLIQRVSEHVEQGSLPCLPWRMEDKKQCFGNKFAYPRETTFWRDKIVFLRLTWASSIKMSAHKGLRPHVDV